MRLPLCEAEGDYLAFERVLAEAMGRAAAPQLFAFCLMPNHWHLLVGPTRDSSVVISVPDSVSQRT
jgi:putative transposase